MPSHIDALDLQAELLRFWDGPAGRQFGRNTASFMVAHEQDPTMCLTTPAREARILRSAEVFWVHRDMCALVEHASLTMPIESLEPEDLPTPTGLVVFEEPAIFGEVAELHPITLESGPPELLKVSHFTWGPDASISAEHGPGINLAFYEPRGTAGRSALPGLINQYWWPFGDRDETDDSSRPEALKIAKSFWSLCQQRIGEPSPGKVDRATARRIERVKLPARVQVIRLRRKTPAPTERKGTNVDWTCRWVVHGFWRNQWYPSTGKHRQRWIDDYVKGPEDKPLRLPDRVYQVDR